MKGKNCHRLGRTPSAPPGNGWVLLLGASILFYCGGCGTDECEESTPEPSNPYLSCTDQDHDGHYAETVCVTSTGDLVDTGDTRDCDDSNARTYPGAEEQADRQDNDCDGTTDEGTIYFDDDGDGYAEAGGDCDDEDPDVYPGATEYVNDAVDSNCDGWLAPIQVDNPETYETTDPGQASAILYGPTDTPNVVGLARFIGDMDGDSRDDIAWSSAYDDGGCRVFVSYTPDGGLEGTQPYDKSADWVLTNAYLPNALGLALSHGDLNGDGLDDLVVGDYIQRRVSVFYGGTRRSGAVDISDADVTFRPLAEGAFPIGYALSVPGDIDQDGFDDLLIGQPGYGMGRGRVALFYGRPAFDPLVDMADADAFFEGAEDLDGAGMAVFDLGDLDADGYPDFAVSAPGAVTGTRVINVQDEDQGESSNDSEPVEIKARGRVYLYYGSDTRWQGVVSVADAPANLASDVSDPAALTGVSLASGDVDGDGARDMVLGLPHFWAEEEQQYGMAIVLYGDHARLSGEYRLTDLARTILRPRSPYDTFGDQVVVADLLGDGRDDVAVASMLSGGEEWADGFPALGYVAVFEGLEARDGERVASEDQGTIIDAGYGVMEYIYSLDASGDANQDSRPDLLVGSDFYPATNQSQSSVLLFHGGDLP